MHRLIDALLAAGAPRRDGPGRGMIRFAAIGLDHRHIYHHVAELIAAGAECAGYCPQTSDPRVLAGFRERFPELRPVDRERLLDDPSIAGRRAAPAIPRDRAGHRDPGDARRQGRDGRQAGRARPRPISPRSSRTAAETGRIVLGLLLRALRRAGRGTRRTKLVADGCDRPGRADRRPRAASAQPRHPTGLVLRPAGLRRHPQRHRLASDRPVPVLHGADDAEIVASAVANYAMPDAPWLRGLRRDAAAQRGRAPASCASTGSRPTGCRPGATVG